MPLQIKSFRLKDLIASHDHDTSILRKYYKEELRLGAIEQIQVLRIFAKRKAIRQVLLEVQKQKSTKINVSQIKLF